MNYDSLPFYPPRQNWMGDDNQYIAYVEGMSERDFQNARDNHIRALNLTPEDLNKYRFAKQDSVPFHACTNWRREYEGEWYYRLENFINEPQYFPEEMFLKVLDKPWLYATYVHDTDTWVLVDDPKEKEEYDFDRSNVDWYVSMAYEFFDPDAEGKYRMTVASIDELETRKIENKRYGGFDTQYAIHNSVGNVCWVSKSVVEQMMKLECPCYLYYGHNPGRFGEVIRG